MSKAEELDAAALLLTARDLQSAIGCAVLAVRAQSTKRAAVHLIDAQRAPRRLEIELAAAARAAFERDGGR
jgi:hypothetical protein